MIILGIETSCDETSAAIIEGNKSDKKVKLVSNVVASSLSLHSKTGGIIPEVAARQQIKYIIPVIKKALVKDIDAIAITYGPGLIGSLLVGVETAKTLSYVWKKPIIPVNHLIGHIYSNFIDNDKITFPFIGLITSGAHTDLLLFKSHDKYIWLGGTRDDAAGECFDKCARLLGYDYPGGPKISELAERGNLERFKLPSPLINSKDFDFSFSGLKTAFFRLANQHFPITKTDVHSNGFQWQQIDLEKTLSQSELQTLCDLCASLQKSIVDVLVIKTLKAAQKYNVKSILLCGGVAANQKLRNAFKAQSSKLKVDFFVPQKNLCTDNAAMIATTAFFKYKPLPWRKITANPELYFD
ncbi:MAG: hypothetical protein ACD_50C00333G0016 [uncultured bacterium]|nr:MAG: hypothetical protein ACD_50C00333G0016 [uncultured bacterium]OGH13803.1 MAG: tRNA (adenosine(37)-N6)-threonylcarbamoyltransferase complex transferase subunit TsaD [Candidatus Levybacteria bacterium RIFCSPHIGHO2_01_FULL_38_26]